MDQLHALSLDDVLAEHARSRPEQLATIDGDRRHTYRVLARRVEGLARGLRRAGVNPDDRVLWLGQNSDRVLELLLASARLGACFCPANWRSSAAELAFVVDDLDPAVVIWQDEEIGASVREARRRATSGATWLRHDDEPDAYEALVEEPDGSLERAVDPSAPALIVYTAAFGGRPNGAMLSHVACIAQGLVYGHFTGTSADDVYLNSGPLFHLGTLMHTLATFVAGGTNVFVRRVDAELLCEVVERERCSGAFVVGPMFDAMLSARAEHGYDLSSLRAVPGNPAWDAVTSVDPSPWARRPGGYGQTELVGMVTFSCLGLDAAGSHGRPSPLAQLRIVDEDDADVPDGDVGEIVVRGPTVMTGYWNRPEENARRQRDGWHHTHDLGRREPDGSLTFIGPKTRMIKSAAENIYPAEVEGALAAHPAVAECAVIGVPDPTWVQHVKAIVVRRGDGAVSAEELIDFCRDRIAPYKRPREVEFVDALPRTGLSVDYDRLDAAYGGGNYPGGRTRSA